MSNIQVLLQYDGEWVDDNKFINHKADGVLLPADCSYTYFLGEIVKQLEVDTSRYALDIKYLIEDGYQPITIKNDMCARLYVEMKKSSKISEYPLCITKKEILPDVGSSNTALVVNTSPLIERERLYDINIPDVVEMLTSGTSEVIDGVPLDEMGVIDNPQHEVIEENQVYKDKETLQSVMKNYAMRAKFDFSVDRSSSTRYSLSCVNKSCSSILRSSSLNGSNVFAIWKFVDVHSCPIEERLISQWQFRLPYLILKAFLQRRLFN